MKLLKWLWANKWHELGHPAGELAIAFLAGVFFPGLSLVVQLLIGWAPNMAFQILEPITEDRRWKADDFADLASLQVIWPLALVPDWGPAFGVLGAVLLVYLVLRARAT